MTMNNEFNAYRYVPVFSQEHSGEHCNIYVHKALNKAFKFFLETTDFDLVLNYRGPFQDDITTRIVDISEKSIEESNGSPKVQRKVSFLLVECFQNIIKHADHSIEEHPNGLLFPGMFSFRNKEHTYCINSINPVKPEDIGYLRKTVDLVNSMDRDTLKRLYLRQLSRSELDHKGGAGLGLIELARKSGQTLQYEFEERENDRPYFHQQVAFVDAGAQTPGPMDYVQDTKRKYEEMHEAEIELQYKGDFTQKSILPLLQIVENNLKLGEKNAQGLKLGHALVEILQNISKHAAATGGRKEGIFMMGNAGNETFIVAANILSNENKQQLFEKLDSLKGLEIQQLKELHIQKIKKSIFSEDKSNAGLGLIEIARASQGRLAYDFRPFDANNSFFSLFACV